MPRKIDVKNLPYYVGTPIFHSYFQDNQYYFTVKTTGTEINLLEGVIKHGTFLGKDYNQRSTDLYLPLLDWYSHCIKIPGLYTTLRKIESDLANICVVFYRYQDVLSSKHSLRQCFFLKSDLEFLFYNIRSLFDLTQFFYQCLWKNSLNSQGKSPPTSLPNSFAKMVLFGSELRSVEEIIKKYLIPVIIAQVYVDYGGLFRDCRDIRDQVVHYGKNIESVFIKDKKAFVDVTKHPFDKINCWGKESIDKNNLGELLVLLQFLLRTVIQYMEDLAIALNRTYSPIALIHSDWKMYVCHPLFLILKDNI